MTEILNRAEKVKTIGGAIAVAVTLLTMLVGGIIWIYSVRADTDRALDAVARLEVRMDEQTKSNRKLHDALIRLTVSVDSLTRAYERRGGGGGR